MYYVDWCHPLVVMLIVLSVVRELAITGFFIHHHHILLLLVQEQSMSEHEGRNVV